MKKKSFIGLMGIASFFTFFSSMGTNLQKVFAAQGTYQVSSFTSLPSTWSVRTGCDEGNGSVSFSNGEMVIRHNSNSDPGNGKYFGLVYNIDIEHNYTDFTFEMNFKMNSAQDANRWIGVVYHTKDVGGVMTGYGMNYRQNGDSAFTAINSSKSFSDGSRVNKSVPLSDGNYHTIKIAMTGNKSTHYIDNKQIVNWDIEERKSHLGGNINSGGFALIVNRSSINVKSIKITGDRSKALVKDEELVSTYDNTKLNNFPTVVCDVKNEDKLDELKNSTTRPSNAILHIDEEMNVVDDSKNVIDTFSNVFKNVLKKQIIPIVYIDSDSEANALIAYLREDTQILDMAVMSNEPSLVKKVKEAFSHVRGIIRYENEEELANIVHTTNKNYANVAVISQEMATYANVSYIQARFKTVWVEQSSEDNIDLYSSINSGAYGLIVEDYESIYSLYDNYEYSFDESTNSRIMSITRTPFNVAHRGLPSEYNENSVTGVEAAISKGATHLELDCYLTTDNEVVIMHDSSIDRTTNGTGQIESYSLSQLKQFNLDDKSNNGDKIPTLEEVAEPIRESNKVLVLEIKSSKVGIVQIIKNKLSGLGMMDNTVFISFNKDILSKAKEVIPEIPTADLNSYSQNDMKAALYNMGLYNTGIDTSYSNFQRDTNMSMLRDRGIIGWYWTYNSNDAIASGTKNGNVGLTNNFAGYFSDKIQSIKPTEMYLMDGETIDDLYITLIAHYYNGTEEEIDGEIFSYEDMGDYYMVIASYSGSNLTNNRNDEIIMYTQAFRVDKPIDITPDNPSGGDVEKPNDKNENEEGNENPAIPYIILGCSGGILIIISGIAFFIIKNKKRI